MGYVRLIDSETNRAWELPLDAYEPAIGGYRNPVQPDLLLQKRRTEGSGTGPGSVLSQSRSSAE